jgi:Cu/Ag efflux pump CusA
MIDGLIRWSLQHRAIVVAMAAAFLVWGGWTATRIPLDVLPDLTAPSVTILADVTAPNCRKAVSKLDSVASYDRFPT